MYTVRLVMYGARKERSRKLCLPLNYEFEATTYIYNNTYKDKNNKAIKYSYCH